jgi:hypothetical protein
MSIRLYRVFLWPLLSDGASQEASGHLLKSSKENVKWILAALLTNVKNLFTIGINQLQSTSIIPSKTKGGE